MNLRRFIRYGLLVVVLLVLLLLLLPGAAEGAADIPQVSGQPLAKSALTIFNDVFPGDPYSTAIYALVTAQIISGFPDYTFRPDAPIKRMQFAKMICLGMLITPAYDDNCPFWDVPSNLDPLDPFYPDHYITAAYRAGVIKGKTSTSYAPYDSITRYQLISMMVRACQEEMPWRLKTPPSSYRPTWDPAGSKDHGQNARLAEYNGLLAGIPISDLNPWGAIPRGEVAQIVYNTIF